jgi:hypothetical protein
MKALLVAFLKGLGWCAGVAVLMHYTGRNPDWKLEDWMFLVALCTPFMTGFFLIWDRVFPLLFPKDKQVPPAARARQELTSPAPPPIPAPPRAQEQADAVNHRQ